METVTIRELIKELAKYPPDMPVVISRDEEGNGFYEGIYPESEGGIVILWPGGAEKELDEIEGFEREDED